MDISPDADESVGQSAGAALVLRLRCGVVGEHSLDIETQHQTQEAAGLTLLRETCRSSGYILCLHNPSGHTDQSEAKGKIKANYDD